MIMYRGFLLSRAHLDCAKAYLVNRVMNGSLYRKDRLRLLTSINSDIMCAENVPFLSCDRSVYWDNSLLER